MNENADEFFWYLLNNTTGVGSKTFHTLLETFVSPRNVFEAGHTELAHAGCSLRILQEIEHTKETIRTLHQNFVAMQQKGIGILCYGTPPYPPLLQEIDSAPPVLYFLGNPEACTHSSPIAVVGTRTMSSYGERVCTEIAEIALEAECSIVSGLALGVDAKIHDVFVEHNGVCVAVLGSGLAHIQPSSNLPLARNIIKKGGVILSEYPPDTEAKASLYPPRNRIISGMSVFTLVVEAGKHSGALITAHHAAQQGRDVYAVPGQVFSATSEGTNALIADGAQILPNMQSLRDLLHIGKPKQQIPQGALSTSEQHVVTLLQRGMMGFDDLVQKSGMTSASLLATLTALTIKRYVGEEGGGRYYVL